MFRLVVLIRYSEHDNFILISPGLADPLHELQYQGRTIDPKLESRVCELWRDEKSIKSTGKRRILNKSHFKRRIFSNFGGCIR